MVNRFPRLCQSSAASRDAPRLLQASAPGRGAMFETGQELRAYAECRQAAVSAPVCMPSFPRHGRLLHAPAARCERDSSARQHHFRHQHGLLGGKRRSARRCSIRTASRRKQPASRSVPTGAQRGYYKLIAVRQPEEAPHIFTCSRSRSTPPGRKWSRPPNSRSFPR